jgi:hypothetical protein
MMAATDSRGLVDESETTAATRRIEAGRDAIADDRPLGLSRSGLLLAIAGGISLWVGRLLLQAFGRHHLDVAFQHWLVGAAGLGCLMLAGWAAARLFRVGDTPWLMFLAAVAFPLFQPQSKPDTLPWRLGSGLWGLLLVLLAVRAIARMLARGDELQRRINHEALAFAFAVTLVLVVAWSVLQELLPPLQGVWVASALSSTWLVGFGLAARRYQ